MSSRRKRRKAKVKVKAYCVSCKKPILGKPKIMKLQITHEVPKMIACAKRVGFTSPNWRVGQEMRGAFHNHCFNQAVVIWEIAFHTRALSPRRQA